MMTKLTEWTEPTKDPESLSEVLDSRASLFGLSVNALATQVDVTHAVMNNFLTGKTALQLDKLSKTLEVLDIDVSFSNRRKKLAIKCAKALAGKSTEEIVTLTKKELSVIANAKEVEMLIDCNSKEAFKQYLQKDSLSLQNFSHNERFPSQYEYKMYCYLLPSRM
jgi:plasmid maintenance system antidote protein VapI